MIEFNRATPEWRAIETWAAERVKKYSKQLESINLDDKATAILRGRLLEARALLALGDPTPEPIPDDSPGQGDA